jgi:hypothetical protein
MNAQSQDQAMSMSQERKEYLYSQWDIMDEDKKPSILNEFRMKYRGFYTQQIFLTFLENKLLPDCDAINVVDRI